MEDTKRKSNAVCDKCLKETEVIRHGNGSMKWFCADCVKVYFDGRDYSNNVFNIFEEDTYQRYHNQGEI